MSIYQSFNGRIGAWIKYSFEKGKGFLPKDVKQIEPYKPFKGIKIKGNRR